MSVRICLDGARVTTKALTALHAPGVAPPQHDPGKDITRSVIKCTGRNLLSPDRWRACVSPMLLALSLGVPLPRPTTLVSCGFVVLSVDSTLMGYILGNRSYTAFSYLM